LNTSLLRRARSALRRSKRDGLRQRQELREFAENLSGSLRLAFQRLDLCERIFQRDRAIAFARVRGIERLILGRYGCLQTQAVVMLSEPGMKGHRGQKHGEQNSRDFECISHGGIFPDW
jgi:hypothetical protein